MFDIKDMFDKKEMMNDEYGLYVHDMAKQMPITINRVQDYLNFITSYIHRQNKIIKILEADGKDVTSYVYDRDNALYTLGLCEKPEPYWRNNC